MQTTLAIKKSGLRIAWGNFCLDLDERTYIMGILNRTPDSFSDGGRYMPEKAALSHGLKMAKEGADIIDIGGESTRPGSLGVSAEEEMQRVIPVIRALRPIVKIPISIDTSKAAVAEAALQNGAAMVNDITGLKGDPDMAGVIAKYDIPAVLMHIKGTPRTMQVNPCYDDLISEIMEALRESLDIARKAGIDTKKIIIDPGVGFGKTLGHNLKIIKDLRRLKALGRPIMIGLSRKSFIGQVLGLNAPDRLMGTAAGLALSISNGANIVRVHDVKEAREVARMADSICRI